MVMHFYEISKLTLTFLTGGWAGFQFHPDNTANEIVPFWNTISKQM